MLFAIAANCAAYSKFSKAGVLGWNPFVTIFAAFAIGFVNNVSITLLGLTTPNAGLFGRAALIF